MPYARDTKEEIKLRKIGKFWHPIKKNGSLSKIKGSSKQKALNALHAYEARHGAKKKKEPNRAPPTQETHLLLDDNLSHQQTPKCQVS